MSYKKWHGPNVNILPILPTIFPYIVALVHKTPYVELYQYFCRTLLRPKATSLLFFLETEQNDRSPKLRDFHISRQHGYGESEGGCGRGGGVGHGRGDDGGGSDDSFGGSFGG